MSAGITKGKLFSVSGDNATVLWNVITDCHSYKTNSAAFLVSFPRLYSRLQMKYVASAAPRALVGVSSGPLRIGRIGTGKKRFPIADGTPLALAAACATASRHYMVNGLYSHTDNLEPALASIMRPLDVWRIPAAGASAFAEIEMAEDVGQNLDSFFNVVSFEDTAAQPEESANADWRRRFHAALNGDQNAFSGLSEAEASSRTASIVITAMREHASHNPASKKLYRVNAPFYEMGVRMQLRQVLDDESLIEDALLSTTLFSPEQSRNDDAVLGSPIPFGMGVLSVGDEATTVSCTQ